MKKALLLIFLAFSFTAEARIGDNVEQARERYGKEIHLNNETGYMVFAKNGFQIGCYFHKGKIEAIVFVHEKENYATPPITDNEMQELMKANGAGIKWKEIQGSDLIKRTFVNADRTRFAVHDRWDQSFMIGTKAFNDRTAAEKAAEEAKKIEGF